MSADPTKTTNDVADNDAGKANVIPIVENYLQQSDACLSQGDSIGAALCLARASDAAMEAGNEDLAIELSERVGNIVNREVPGFETNDDYLQAELRYVYYLLHLDALRRTTDGDQDVVFDARDMSVTALSSIDALDRFRSRDRVSAVVRDGWENAAALRMLIDRRLIAAMSRGIDFPLVRLANTLQLVDADWLILMLLLAPALDPDVYQLYKASWKDVAKRRPDVWFLARMLYGNREEQQAAMRRLTPAGPLVQNNLVQIFGGSGDKATLLPFRQVMLPPSVAEYLQGRVSYDPVLKDIATLSFLSPEAEFAAFNSQEKLVATLLEELETPTAAFHVLVGATGVGRKTCLFRVAQISKRPILSVTLSPLLLSNAYTLIQASLRDALLYRAVLHIHLELEGPADQIPAKKALLDAIPVAARESRIPLFITSDAEQAMIARRLPQARFFSIDIPTAEEQLGFWRLALAQRNIVIPNADTIRQGTLKGMTPADIFAASSLIEASGTQSKELNAKDLRSAARRQLESNLSELARNIQTRLSWTDIILPDDVLERVMDVVTFVRYQDTVMQEWGFGKKYQKGRGTMVLFSGPSGTGKTTLAALLARELGIDVFQVELSRLVSKYIGETEKNLKTLFDEAERVGAGLLFDEADSVFGKRTSGESSTDRYANMETNYLLQRVETTDCLVIMTTNYPDNMDPAFMRRIQFNVKFPFPDKEDRERLWKSQIPKEAKLAEDVSFDFLASEYELSGGRIRNAVLTAAFKAVEGGQAITTAMLEEGARKEYRAMGRIVREQVETP